MSEIEAPPRSGWAPMVPELLVQDFEVSLAFWCGVLGFEIAYQRPEQNFAYLERPEGAQVMLCQRAGNWETGPLERPFGRGAMFQIYVHPLVDVETAIARAGVQLHHGPREVWRRTGDRESGQREIFVLDPDGYLIMMAERIGERVLPILPQFVRLGRDRHEVSFRKYYGQLIDLDFRRLWKERTVAMGNAAI